MPTEYELALSHALADRIKTEIRRDGWMSFARFFELALYAPGLGYYEGRFGADFVTAPEISPLFARSLARQVAQVLDDCGGDILEFGAGSGRLASDLMIELERLGNAPRRYRIVEISSMLAARQKELIEKRAPHLAERFEWLVGLPDRLTGFVFANEVLDAMPVHVIAWRTNGVVERGVTLEDDRFIWEEKPLGEGKLLEAACGLPIEPEYVSEISLAVPALVARLGEMLEHGAILFIDYGFGEAEYYHPQRSSGTLMCHYRNRAHDDPFYLPGLQDITSHVNFSSVASAGTASGLALLGYTTQANFLINCGITELLGQESPENPAEYLPLSAGVQKLLSPSEMGELFKVIALGRQPGAPLLGFQRGGKTHLL